MRSRYQPPHDKQYFHTKPKIEKRDMVDRKEKNSVNSTKKENVSL